MLSLDEILNHINNYFFVKGAGVKGEIKIVDGEISLSDSTAVPLVQDQYFLLAGSVFNDGVHKYLDETDVLKDETFNGCLYPMAVPAALLALVTEIQTWQTTYGDKAASPFMSESFAGYSYQKSSGSTTAGVTDWKTAFGKRLDAWRKLHK